MFFILYYIVFDQSMTLVVAIRNNLFKELLYGHGAEVALFALTDRDGVVFDVLIADNDHVRHLFELCFANLVANLLAAVVDLAAEAPCLQAAS